MLFAIVPPWQHQQKRIHGIKQRKISQLIPSYQWKNLGMHPSSMVGILHHYRYVRLYADNNLDFCENPKCKRYLPFTWHLWTPQLAIVSTLWSNTTASNRIAHQSPEAPEALKAPKAAKGTHWIVENKMTILHWLNSNCLFASCVYGLCHYK